MAGRESVFTILQRVSEMIFVRGVTVFPLVFLALRLYTCYELLFSILR